MRECKKTFLSSYLHQRVSAIQPQWLLSIFWDAAKLLWRGSSQIFFKLKYIQHTYMEVWCDLVSCFQPNSAFTFPAPLLAPSQLLQAASLLSHFLSKFMLFEEKWKFTFFLFLNLAKIAQSTFMANSCIYFTFHNPLHLYIQLSGVEFHPNLHFTHFTQTRSSPLQLQA